MGQRGRKAAGVYGWFVDPTMPSALWRGCQRVLGAAAPSLASVYRYFDLGWAETLPTEVGSCSSTHPDWACYDSNKRRPVVDCTSVAASVTSFAAARHQEGYALRGENLRTGGSNTNVGCPSPSPSLVTTATTETPSG